MTVFESIAALVAARIDAEIASPDAVAVARAQPLSGVNRTFYNVLLGEIAPLGDEAILGFNVVNWEFPLMVEVSVICSGVEQEKLAFSKLADGMGIVYAQIMGTMRRLDEGKDNLVRILPAGFGEIVFDRDAQALRGVQRAVFEFQVRTNTASIGV